MKGQPTRSHNRCWHLFPASGARLYVMQLTDGKIKIGCSNSMRGRALSYAYAQTGNPIVRIHVFGPLDGDTMHAMERRAIYLAAEHGARIGKTEYFTGLPFEVARDCVRAVIKAAAALKPSHKRASKPQAGKAQG